MSKLIDRIATPVEGCTSASLWLRLSGSTYGDCPGCGRPLWKEEEIVLWRYQRLHFDCLVDRLARGTAECTITAPTTAGATRSPQLPRLPGAVTLDRLNPNGSSSAPRSQSRGWQLRRPRARLLTSPWLSRLRRLPIELRGERGRPLSVARFASSEMYKSLSIRRLIECSAAHFRALL